MTAAAAATLAVLAADSTARIKETKKKKLDYDTKLLMHVQT